MIQNHRKILVLTTQTIARSIFQHQPIPVVRQRLGPGLHTSSSVVLNQVPSVSETQSSKIPVKLSKPKTKEIPSASSNTALDPKLSQILNSKDTQNVTLAEACSVMSSLAAAAGAPESESAGPGIANQLEADSRFIQFHNLIHKGNHVLNPFGLYKTILALESIGFPKTSYFIKELENELKWIMRRCPIRFLPRIISAYLDGNESGDENCSQPHPKLSISIDKSFPPDHPIHIALSILQRRWVEVTTGQDFISVFRISNQLSPETRDKLEDRAVEVVQDFQPVQMLRIFIVLSEQSRRPTPLLRSLAFHLAKTTDRIETKDWIDLLYALNRLTFADPVLMERICTDLQPEIPALDNPASISSIITCLGQMRYNHPTLVQSLTEWLTKHLENSALRSFDLAAWVLMASVLGIESASTLYPELSAKISNVFAHRTNENDIEWINIVHALTILKLSTPSQIGSVLEKGFAQNIDALERNMSSKIKLLNLNTLARQEMSGVYKGPYLDSSLTSKWAKSYLSPNDTNLSKSVLDSLSNFLPPPKYLQTNLKLEAGVFVDGACNLNEKLDPIPLNPAPTTSPGTGKSIPCPGNPKIRKLAILVQGYPVFTLGHKVPTGGNLLNVRLLQNLGYYVIPVPFTEFSPKDKLVRRVQYLEKRIRNFDSSKNNNSKEDLQMVTKPTSSHIKENPYVFEW